MNEAEPRWLRVCSDPRFCAGACAWLFLLTVFGTLAQTEIGLWQAQERYFSAWLLWLGPLPLPGGRLTLALVGLNLLALLCTRRGLRNPGLALLHAGILLLLGGALLGEALRREGSLGLLEGERAAEMRAWNHHELVLLVSDAVGDRLVTVGEDLLADGAIIADPALPGAFEVVAHHANAALAEDGSLVALPLELEHERNQAGVLLRLTDGTLAAIVEGGAAPPIAPGLRAGLRRVRTSLPIALELVRFQRENHPGTDTPRHFASEVIVHDAGGARHAVISMNRPLQLGAWTFYQQSWEETPRGTVSVLAVVHDRFRLSPYVASAIMLLGLLLHLVLRQRQGRTP